MKAYRRHVFFCLNSREDGSSCMQLGAEQAFKRCKDMVKAAGMAGPGGVRVNRAGCLNRCEHGPVAVVYPEGTWYTYVDESDVEDITKTHLQQGKVVERLQLKTDPV